MQPPKPKPGRPKLPQRATYDKPRQLGRISDEEWAQLQAAAERAGLPFTQWAKSILLRAATRQK